jgi:hypothetical protein
MILDSYQTVTRSRRFRGKRSSPIGSKLISDKNSAGSPIWTFVGLSLLFILISLPLWFFTNSAAAV